MKVPNMLVTSTTANKSEEGVDYVDYSLLDPTHTNILTAWKASCANIFKRPHEFSHV